MNGCEARGAVHMLSLTSQRWMSPLAHALHVVEFPLHLTQHAHRAEIIRAAIGQDRSLVVEMTQNQEKANIPCYYHSFVLLVYVAFTI